MNLSKFTLSKLYFARKIKLIKPGIGIQSKSNMEYLLLTSSKECVVFYSYEYIYITLFMCYLIYNLHSVLKQQKECNLFHCYYVRGLKNWRYHLFPMHRLKVLVW